MTNDMPFPSKAPEVIGLRPSRNARSDTTAIPDPRPALTTGDATAWTEVVAQYQPLLLSRARRHGLCPEEAADVSQQTWMRLLEHAGDIRQPERLPGWLATTANRESIAARRRSWREEPTPDTSLDGTLESHSDDRPDDRLDAQHRAQALRAAVDRLPPRDRRLIEILLEPDPPTYAEISTRLQMPIGSIGPIRGRALRRLRRHLHSLAAAEAISETATTPRRARRDDDRLAHTSPQPTARSAQAPHTTSTDQEQINASHNASRVQQEIDHDTCDASLAGGPLNCVRPRGHAWGHEFHSGQGSWVEDRHGEGGHG